MYLTNKERQRQNALLMEQQKMAERRKGLQAHEMRFMQVRGREGELIHIHIHVHIHIQFSEFTNSFTLKPDTPSH